jgi:hypothetical protein
MQKAMKWRWVFLIACALLAPVCASATTYYIDFADGNDGHNGTSKATPWKHTPGMQNCTANCGSRAPVPGDSVIFKGGVTWDSTCWSWVLPSSGTLGNPIYYGVDQSWFTGANWTRPIFDGGMVVPTVASLLRVNSVSNLTFDNIEMKNLLASNSEGPAFLHLDTAGDILMENLYLHGWDLQEPGNPNDGAHGAVYVSPGLGGNIVDHTTISNTEFSTTHNNGVAIKAVDVLSFSTVHDVSSFCLGCVTVHDSTIYDIDYPTKDFDLSYHTNGHYMIGSGAADYNNLYYNFEANAAPIYPNTGNGGSGNCLDWTQYVYNNVVIIGSNRVPIAIDANPATTQNNVAFCGAVFVYNNTIQANGTLTAIRSSGWTNSFTTVALKSLTVQNNHIINAAGTDQNCFSITCDSTDRAPQTLVYNHTVFQTNAAASAQGYSRANNYSPALPTNGTVGMGVAHTNLFDKDIRGVIRPQTRWDVGAYEFSSARPNPPANVQSAIH